MRSIGPTASNLPAAMLRSPGLLFLLWAIWLASPYVLFGPNSYCRWHDNADSFLALLQANGSAGVSGAGRWWNPLIVAGGDAETSLQLPAAVRWLFLPLPGWLAYGLLMGSQRFLAGYFLYRLLRDEFVLAPWAAVYGGLTFALFSQGAINDGWQGYNLCDGFSLPGIPATLWALARIDLCRTRARWIAAAGLGVLVALGQTFPFAIFYFVGYFLWFAAVKPRTRLGFWALFATFAIGWLVAQALPLWASMLNAPLSQRAFWDSSSPPHPDDAWYARMAVGLIRDNVLPLGLLVLGLISSRLRDRRLVVLTAVVVAILAYLASYSSFQRNIFARLGFLSGFNFSRVSYLFPFLCDVAGAAALPVILGGGELQLIWRKRLVATTAMAVPVALLAMLLTAGKSIEIQIRVLRQMLSGENYAAFYRNPLILALARDYRAAPPFRVATVCNWGEGVGLHAGMLWAYGLATVDGQLQMYPKRYHRFWGRVIQDLLDTHPKDRDYFRNYGCRVYLFGPGSESDPAHVRDLYDLDLLSLANVRFIVSPISLEDDRLTLVQSTGGHRSDARGSGAHPGRLITRLLRFLKDGPEPLELRIYENRDVIPRFFLAHRSRVFGDREQLLDALARASREELATTAFLLRDEFNGPELRGNAGAKAAVQPEVNLPERIVLSVDADRPGIAVVTQNYSPFWRVRIDGLEDRVVPVDHTFMGVLLEAGRHEVVLTYQPPYKL